MFKVLMSLFFIAANASATECVNKDGSDIFNQPDVFQKLIEDSSSCYEAEKLAQSCAYGSSLDVQTAGAAYGVCKAELLKVKPSKEHLALLVQMEAECEKTYEKAEGTLYRSMNAFCHLSAIDWILGIATPVE